MTHGYMLSGTGSNIYVQNLCRALVREGHEIHLLCREQEPLAYDFVAGCYVVDGERIEQRGEQETPYPGRCAVYKPEIGDLLPVYVYDDYPGWRVKTFLDLTDEELESYLGRRGRHHQPLGAGAPDLPPGPRRCRRPIREHRPRQLPPVRRPQEREVHAHHPRGPRGGEEDPGALLPQRWHHRRGLPRPGRQDHRPPGRRGHRALPARCARPALPENPLGRSRARPGAGRGAARGRGPRRERGGTGGSPPRDSRLLRSPLSR